MRRNREIDRWQRLKPPHDPAGRQRPYIFKNKNTVNISNDTKTPAPTATGVRRLSRLGLRMLTTKVPAKAVMDLPFRKARNAVVLEFELRFLKHIIERAKGNLAKAARIGRMDRSHLYSLLRRHNLR